MLFHQPVRHHCLLVVGLRHQVLLHLGPELLVDVPQLPVDDLELDAALPGQGPRGEGADEGDGLEDDEACQEVAGDPWGRGRRRREGGDRVEGEEKVGKRRKELGVGAL